MSAVVAAPILLTVTLLVSGVAKLGQRQSTQDAMSSLRLPAPGLHRAAAVLLPPLEIVLAMLLWVPVPAVQVTVSALVAVLMVAYLVIIARALAFEEQVECSCFGTLASPTVSRSTLARNILLSAAALVSVAAAASGVMTHAVLHAPAGLAGWSLALLTAIALTVLALGGVQRSGTRADVASGSAGTVAGTAGAGDETTADDELLDYERDPIPAGVLQRPDGSLVTLRQLAAQRAALLLFVSEGCGPCERVLDEVPGWTADLSSFMQVKSVFRMPVSSLRERTRPRVGEHAMHDPRFSAREALGARSAPSAVLLGADGMLAGGPVEGAAKVAEFVGEIQEQLRLAQEDGELAAPAPE